MIKLIASDMDGTLLDNKDRLPEDFFETAKRLKEKNIIFSAASGRQYFNLLNKFSPIKDDILFIAENGSYIVYKNEEQYSSTLDKKTIQSLLNVARQIKGCEIILCGKKSAYVEKNYSKFISEVERYYLKYEIVETLNDVEDDILKFTICDFIDAAENSNNIITPLFGDKLQISVSGKIWLDIINKDINKGVAIKFLQQKFNIKPEETMVFGDYFNDIQMLDSAYHSYAMENAPEEVKKHARFITKSNTENGVLEVIQQKIL